MECVTQEEFLCMFHVVFNSTMSNESFFCAVLLINVCDVSGSEDFQEKQNIILQASIIIILVILIIIILHGSIITILVILLIIILHASIIILDIIISSSVIIKK